jgi:hypothetical protein
VFSTYWVSFTDSASCLDINGTNPREQARKVTLRQILGNSVRPRIWINRAVTAETVSRRKREEWVDEFHRLEKQKQGLSTTTEEANEKGIGPRGRSA